MIDSRNNFMGLNGFVWWVGVIENVNDELAVARYQIRIHGWHTDNKSILPTKDLQWAYPVLPINCANTFSALSVGDWVIGFFMDGENAQHPYIFGTMPYIKTSPTPVPTST